MPCIETLEKNDYSGSVILKRIIQSKVVIAREEWDSITGALIMCTTNQPAFGPDPSQLSFPHLT